MRNSVLIFLWLMRRCSPFALLLCLVASPAFAGLKAVSNSLGNGTVPIANGGTGATNAAASQASIDNSQMSQFPTWRQALYGALPANGRSDSRNGKVLCIGDSTEFGYTGAANPNTNNNFNSRCWRMAFALNNIYGVPTLWDSNFGTGNINQAGAAGNTANSNITVGTGWVVSTSVSLGGQMYEATGATSSLSYVSSHPVDTFKIYYSVDSGLGTFAANIDGGSNTTQSESGSIGMGTMTLSASAIGVHTLNLNYSSGGTVDIIGWEAYNSTQSHIQVYDGGISSVSSVQWALTNGGWQPIDAIKYLAPDLCIINIGINDARNATSIPTFTTNMNAVIAACRASGDVLLESFAAYSTGVTGQSTQASYYNALVSIANSYSPVVPFNDLWARWGGTYATAPAGEFVDTIHPNAAGYADQAQARIKMLAPAVPVTEPNPQQTYYGFNTLGLVGIGTTSPVAQLDLTRSISLPAYSTGGAKISERSSTITDTTTSGTIGVDAVNSFFPSTLAAVNAGVTYSSASTFLVYPPAAGTNVSISVPLSIDSVGQIRVQGAQNVIGSNAGTFNATLRLTGTHSQASWTTTGADLNIDTATLTDSSSGNGATITSRAANSISIPTFASTGTGQTITDGSSLYIAGAPANGTNVTITNGHALWVAAGDIKADGGVTTTTINATTIATGYKLNGSNGLSQPNATSLVIGPSSATSESGIQNTSIGVSALNADTTGTSNIAIGYQALLLNTTGINNTAIGTQALATNTIGYYDTAIGYQALNAVGTGYYNTAIGMSAGLLIGAGTNNTIIGATVGSTVLTSGTGNILIGTNNTVTTAGAADTSEIAIGCTGLGSNTACFGIPATTTATTIYGTITAGTLGSASATTICRSTNTLTSCTSLRKWKENEVPLSLGLEAIMALEPKEFDWKGRNGIDRHDLGFIAEDVERVSPLLAEYESPDNDKSHPKHDQSAHELSGVKYTQMTSLLVKGMQEQQKEIEQLHPGAFPFHKCFFGLLVCAD